MKNVLDMTQYITNNYYGAKAISFEEASIEIKKSAQVRIKNEKPKEYYEIGSQTVSSKSDIRSEDLIIQTKANIGSLENQKLMVGDVLITIRAKFRYAKVITESLLSHGLPVVAVKGHIVLRTRDVKKAEFIKFYLERDEIRNYINTHDNAKSDTGKYSIEPSVIQSIFLPDTVNGNLELFTENSETIKKSIMKSNELTKILEFISNKQREKFCRHNIQTPETYSDTKLWEELAIKFEEMIEAGNQINLS